VLPAIGSLAAVAAGWLAWGWFEAGWVRLRTLEVPVPGLPPELDGLRVHHLSDFHLGVPGRGRVAVERGVEWSAGRRADLVCVTGDLLSRRSGESELRRLVERLDRPHVVLGNHDYALSRDPFSQPVELRELPGATLLADTSVRMEHAGRRVQVAGLDPRSYSRGRSRPWRLADPDADLRILLSHFPGVVRKLPRAAFHLVLSGHLHGGQICVPYPGGKVLLAHPRARYREGLYRQGDTVLHVSPGLGTTFVPFRYFARPEATELVLNAA
jgi:predicted MPP superfamily phosphohydrolase